MQSSQPVKPIRSWWSRNRGWFLCIIVPLIICFAGGAKFGWWFIEKDAGRHLRDMGTDVEEHVYYEAAVIYGAIAGAAGAIIGLGTYGSFRLVRRLLRESSH